MILSPRQSDQLTDNGEQDREPSPAGIDTALIEIRRAIDARQFEVRKITKEIDDLEAAYKALAGQKKPESGQLTSDSPGNFAKRQRERRSSLAWQIRQEASRILTKVGRPLTRKELLLELTKAGIYTGKDDPAKKVGKIMWDAKEFRHTGEGYWFSDRPLKSLVKDTSPAETRESSDRPKV